MADLVTQTDASSNGAPRATTQPTEQASKVPERGYWQQIKRFISFPIAAIILILIGLFVFTEGQAQVSAAFTLDAFLRLLPFIVLSVVLAAGLKASSADQLVARALSGHPAKAIVVAS